MTNFPQWHRRVVTFPFSGGALVHVDGKIGSGKTTFFDALAFALTGIARASISVMGGVAANGGKAPEVSLVISTGEWRLTRSKKRNGLIVSLLPSNVRLQDDVAQTWIARHFGVTDHMLYVASYMPHRRPRSGLLCMAPGTRREVLQNHFAEGLHLGRKHVVQTRFLATLAQLATELGAGLRSMQLVPPLQKQRGSEWMQQVVLPHCQPASPHVAEVITKHGILARMCVAPDSAVVVHELLHLQAADLLNLVKQGTPEWHTSMCLELIDSPNGSKTCDKNRVLWQKGLWNAIPQNVQQMVQVGNGPMDALAALTPNNLSDDDQRESSPMTIDAAIVALRDWLNEKCTATQTAEHTAPTTVSMLQSHLASAIEIDAVLQSIATDADDDDDDDAASSEKFGEIATITEKRDIVAQLAAIDHLTRLMRDAAYAIEHSRHEQIIRAEQRAAIARRHRCVQEQAHALCVRLRLLAPPHPPSTAATSSSDGDDAPSTITAESVMLALDTLQRRIHGIWLLDTWIQDVALPSCLAYTDALARIESTVYGCEAHGIPIFSAQHTTPAEHNEDGQGSIKERVSRLLQMATDTAPCPCCGTRLSIQEMDTGDDGLPGTTARHHHQCVSAVNTENCGNRVTPPPPKKRARHTLTRYAPIAESSTTPNTEQYELMKLQELDVLNSLCGIREAINHASHVIASAVSPDRSSTHFAGGTVLPLPAPAHTPTTETPAVLLGHDPCDIPGVDTVLTTAWMTHCSQTPDTLWDASSLATASFAARERVEQIRTFRHQHCAVAVDRLGAARKELTLYRSELSRAEGSADCHQYEREEHHQQVAPNGRWPVPPSMHNGMREWAHVHKMHLQSDNLTASDDTLFASVAAVIHPDWFGVPFDTMTISEAAVCVQQQPGEDAIHNSSNNHHSLQSLRATIASTLATQRATETSARLRATMREQRRDVLDRTDTTSQKLYQAMRKTSIGWTRRWIRDQDIIGGLRHTLSDLTAQEQHCQQYAAAATAFNNWVADNEAYCSQVDAWLQQVWVHVCALGRVIRLERSMQILHEASLVANGAFVELAVQRLAATINHFLATIIPDVELTVDLCLSGNAKNANSGAHHSPNSILTLTGAMASHNDATSGNNTSSGGSTSASKPQVLVCTRLRGVELDMDALSGGQYFALQLASMTACATVTNSRLLMLDEALGLMDEATLARVMVPLAQLARSNDILILSIAHNMHSTHFDGTLAFDETADRITYAPHKINMCLFDDDDEW